MPEQAKKKTSKNFVALALMPAVLAVVAGGAALLGLADKPFAQMAHRDVAGITKQTLFATRGLVKPLQASKGAGIIHVSLAGSLSDSFFSSLAEKNDSQEEQSQKESHFDDAAGLKAFYAARDFQPVWVKEGGTVDDRASDLLEVLRTSENHGLNPANYHVAEIARLLSNPLPAGAAKLELLLSDGLVRYGRDMTGMRVEARKIRQHEKYWRTPMGGQEILALFAGVDDPFEAARALEPRDPFYTALKDELARLREVEDPEENIAYQEIDLRGILRPGDGHKVIGLVRTRLGVEEISAQGDNYYDDILARAVMDFQRENGLDPDGVIGAKTLSFMNRTRQDRIHQVLANMERIRWLEQERPERYVVVNIPSAMLWAVEQERIKIEMPVIVGHRARPTASFRTEITGVRFNPDWTVPPTVKQLDYLPKLRQDPYALAEKGIEVIRGYGRNAETLDPGTINWTNIDWRELNKLRMVQGPGETNPLGRVRIIMENPYNIYLHDTDKPSYFGRRERALSSGCIRMGRPEELAQFVLRNNPDWSQKEMVGLFKAGEKTDVDTATPMPVYILYQTMWQRDDGKLVYGHDIYGRDRRLIKELSTAGALTEPLITAEHLPRPKPYRQDI